ncbi:RNA polymerase sigma factor [Caproiciproducens sp. MSJ-32]|uniref:RNA polymerase sigma factor n=1 Tax=Caproiciproducens sp. MSJ-32 TaxID=2841527 RepID=UPI001C124239|nr:sigma-70 family RNA polymerase sigma factor [Caproiciproducens sp. MSJ-32]
MKNSLLRADKEFIQVYNSYFETVYRVCLMYLKNIQDTEDAVQSTFIKFLQYNGTFNNQEHIKAWLIVTASNTCKNFLKHWWRKNVDIDSLQEQLTISNNENKYIFEKIMNLPQKYKLIIYLYYYEGYKLKEIAEKLNMNDSTVRSYLRRRRNLLRDIIIYFILIICWMYRRKSC